MCTAFFARASTKFCKSYPIISYFCSGGSGRATANTCARIVALCVAGDKLSIGNDASHRCGNPGCVRPSHLIFESNAENKCRDKCQAAGSCSCLVPCILNKTRGERASVGMDALNAMRFASKVALAAPKTINRWQAKASVEQKQSVQSTYNEERV